MSKRARRFTNRLVPAAILLVSTGLSAATEWRVDTVDQTGSGKFSSMRIDNLGNVHVAYIPDEDRHPLKYGFWDHALDKWFTMTVASYASFCTLTLDSKQRPHISYADHGTAKGAKLRHIYWAGGADWKQDVVSPKGDAVVGYYTSIALDPQDRPFFSYYDYEGPGGIGFMLRLRAVFYVGTHWEVHMVDRQPGSGKFNSIALDSSGHPHIAYANVKAEFMSLRYASWDGTSWKTETLEGMSEPTGIFSVNLLIDSKDVPHIAYTDVSHRLVKYATKVNNKWRIEVVDRIRREAYPDRNGITLDAQGNPYLSYFDADEGTLKVAFRKGGQWLGEVVARDNAGFTSSLQIHDGVLWVSFADDGNGAFKVAHRRLDEPTAVLPEAAAKRPDVTPRR